MTSIINARVRGLLLDIEGTITPITFVTEILFPYARSRMKHYLSAHFDSPETLADLTRLRAEHALDTQQDDQPPSLFESPRAAAVDSYAAYALWLMDRDRKTAGLKSLQGRIWEQGYTNGELRAPLFADVMPALGAARGAGIKIAIFSSGSVLGQKLLFAHTEAGDLTEFIDFYFDTTTGPKTASESYRQIALALSLAAADMLFVSDVVAELDAARAAGMGTRLCLRPGNPLQIGNTHEIIESFL